MSILQQPRVISVEVRERNVEGILREDVFWGCIAILFEEVAIFHLYPCRKFIKNRTVFSVGYGLILAGANYVICHANAQNRLIFFLPYLGLLTLAFFIDMDYVGLLAAVLLFPTVSAQTAFFIQAVTGPSGGHAGGWISMILPRMILLPLYWFLKRFMIPGGGRVPAGYSVPSVVLSCTAIGVIYFGRELEGESQAVLQAVNVLLCILTLLLYYFYYRVSVEYMEKLQLQLKKKHLEDMVLYVEDLGTLYDNLRKMKHDNANHFLIVHRLLEEKSYDKAVEYFRTLERHQEQTGLFTGSENIALNAILNAKKSVADRLGIRTDLNIGLPEIIVLDDVDLCALIGNLMDNALESCREQEDAELLVQIRQKKAYLLIEVRNTVPGSVFQENPELETTKKDREFHGLGIRIVKDIVSKYKGDVSFKEEEGIFIVQISIPNVVSGEAKY